MATGALKPGDCGGFFGVMCVSHPPGTRGEYGPSGSKQKFMGSLYSQTGNSLSCLLESYFIFNCVYMCECMYT